MKKSKIITLLLIIVFIVLIILGSEFLKKPNPSEPVANEDTTNKEVKLPEGVNEEELKKYLNVFALTKYQSDRVKDLSDSELGCVRAIGMAIQLYEQVDQKEFESSGKFGTVYDFSLINDILKEVKGEEWLQKNIDENDIIKTNNKVFTYAELEDAYHKTEIYDDLKIEGECTEIVGVSQKADKQYEVKFKYRLKNDDDSFSDVLETSVVLQENENFTYSKYRVI